MNVCGITRPLGRLSPAVGYVPHVLRTRPPLNLAVPFDLHVLGTPPAFVLSQDQTLQEFNQARVEQLDSFSRPNHRLRDLCPPRIRLLCGHGSKDPHSILILRSRHLSKSGFCAPVCREPSNLDGRPRPVKAIWRPISVSGFELGNRSGGMDRTSGVRIED